MNIMMKVENAKNRKLLGLMMNASKTRTPPVITHRDLELAPAILRLGLIAHLCSLW